MDWKTKREDAEKEPIVSTNCYLISLKRHENCLEAMKHFGLRPDLYRSETLTAAMDFRETQNRLDEDTAKLEKAQISLAFAREMESKNTP